MKIETWIKRKFVRLCIFWNMICLFLIVYVPSLRKIISKLMLHKKKEKFEGFVRYTIPEMPRPLNNKEWKYLNRNIDIEEENKKLGV